MPRSSDRPTVSFYTDPPVLDEISVLTEKSGLARNLIVIAVIEHYLAALADGTAVAPVKAAMPPKGAKFTALVPEHINAWLTERAKAWNVTRGEIIAVALGSYRTALEAGTVTLPGKPASEPKTAAVAKTAAKDSAVSIRPPAPLRKAPPARWRCGSCNGWRAADYLDGELVMARHYVSGGPGQAVECAGSWKPGTGRPVMDARADINTSNML